MKLEPTPFQRFESFMKKLVAVPKESIQEKSPANFLLERKKKNLKVNSS
jgi:hypothetical protein